MFVGVSRVTLDIRAAASLKAKRQVLRRVTDRVKAKFNVAVAEVEDNDVYTRAVVALAVVGNDRRHVNEMIDKILQFVENIYVAPIAQREIEILSFGDDLFRRGSKSFDAEGIQFLSETEALTIPKGERSLAEAEGLGEFESRYLKPKKSEESAPPRRAKESAPRRSFDDIRALARGLRNRRDWEKE
jgi:uncharacterized protein